MDPISAAKIEEEHRREIRSTFRSAVVNDEAKEPFPFNRKFVVIHFGAYIHTRKYTLPAEFCVAEFSVQDGLTECFHCMIDPGAVPCGYQSDVKDEVKRCGYQYPGYNKDFNAATDCVVHIERLLRKGSVSGSGEEPVILFTMEEHAGVVKACLDWMVEKAATTINYKLRFFPNLLELLLTEADALTVAYNKAALEKPEIDRPRLLKRESALTQKYHALNILKNPDFYFNSETACEYHQQHETVDKMYTCSMNLVKGWIYSALHRLCPAFKFKPIMGHHYPPPEYVDPGLFEVVSSDPGLPSMSQDNTMTPPSSIRPGFLEARSQQVNTSGSSMLSGPALPFAEIIPGRQVLVQARGLEPEAAVPPPLEIKHMPEEASKSLIPRKPMGLLFPLHLHGAGRGRGRGRGLGRGRNPSLINLELVPEDHPSPTSSGPLMSSTKNELPIYVGSETYDPDSVESSDVGTEDELFESISLVDREHPRPMPKYNWKTKQGGAGSSEPNSEF